jgi:hypothetical protein
VSASLGKDTNPGTQSAPVASLSHAIELAHSHSAPGVYACGETWTEPLIVPPYVSLFGGFDCHDGWAYKGNNFRATVHTGHDQIPIKTSGSGGKITISDFLIQADNATIPGGSSIGVFITDVVEVRIQRCEIIPGNAAPGADGESASGPALAGAPGNDGADACSAEVGKGGVSPQSACAGGGSTGGKGGDGGGIAGDGEPGTPDPKDPQNPQAGSGGTGQTAAAGCTAGKPGADGAAGKFGWGGGAHSSADIGHLTPDGYVGEPGEDGQPGAPGQGGGGGGAGLGGAAICGGAKPGGAGGGSGGAGGCGGLGGKGGGAGGSSFAVASRTRLLSIASCKLWLAHGGDGGNGGAGQEGAPGGAPGQGGAGKGATGAGCAGGKGGRGGNGGPGGGGAGGHAMGVVVLEGFGLEIPDTVFVDNSAPGVGGRGGPPENDNQLTFGGTGEVGALNGGSFVMDLPP